jgi:hypothetical protein
MTELEKREIALVSAGYLVIVGSILFFLIRIVGQVTSVAVFDQIFGTSLVKSEATKGVSLFYYYIFADSKELLKTAAFVLTGVWMIKRGPIARKVFRLIPEKTAKT